MSATVELPAYPIIQEAQLANTIKWARVPQTCEQACGTRAVGRGNASDAARALRPGGLDERRSGE